MSRVERENTTRLIRESVEQLNVEGDVLMFLRRTGHRNDGYVQQQIGPYPRVCGLIKFFSKLCKMS